MRFTSVMVMVLAVAAGCGSKGLAEETKSKAESFKGKACGCKGDAACLDKVAAEHDPWAKDLDQRLNGKVTQEQYYAIERVEEAYRTCAAERK